MKMGLALHMAIIEKASSEQWPINLLLLTVPDEEVNSAGMRAAVKELVTLRDKYDLSYKMFLIVNRPFHRNRVIIDIIFIPELWGKSCRLPFLWERNSCG